MGRGRREVLSGERRSERFLWQWSEARELAETGEVVLGSGSNGLTFAVFNKSKVTLPSGENVFLHREPSLFYQEDQRYFFLSQEGSNLTVSSLAPGERPSSHSFENLLNGQALAVSLEEESARLIYQNRDGLFFRDFQDSFYSDTGEYQLSSDSNWKLLANCSSLDKSGLLFASGNKLLYLDPDLEAQEFSLEAAPERAAVSGDPWDPYIALSFQGKVLLLTEEREIVASSPVKDIDALQTATSLAAWLEEEQLVLSNGKTFSTKADVCKLLPLGEVLLGDRGGLTSLSLETLETHQIAPDPISDLNALLIDESEAEVVFSDSSSIYTIKGEI